MEKKNCDSIDMMKFILSFMVVAIHINPIGRFHGYILLPCRIAVPLFFITSGYFLFGKMQNKSHEEQLGIIKKFVVRNLKLYGIWFVVLLPITFKSYNYLEMGAAKLALNFLFGGLFPASWYIMALVIGACIVFYLSKYIDNYILLIGGVLYVLCCLNSNYGGVFCELTPFKQINQYYPARIVNSFPVSIIWLSIGKCFAERKVDLKIKHASIICVISLFLLILEWAFVNKMNITIADDCYFMMIPLCVTVFYIVINMHINFKYALYFRNMSTVIYCLHISLANAIKSTSEKYGISLNGFFVYISVVAACILFTFILNRIKKIKVFGWVKYMM